MIPFLEDDLRTDEGCELSAYPDPQSPLGLAMRKAGVPLRNWRTFPNPRFLDAVPWTVGVGCTGDGIGPETVWTQAYADAELAKRCQQVEGQLDHSLLWWRKLNPVRQAVFGNMVFNLGMPRFLGFKRMLSAAKAAEFDTAAAEMLASEWSAEVGARARRLATQMRAGQR